MKKTIKKWIWKLIVVLIFVIGSIAINKLIDGNSSSWLIGWVAGCFATGGINLIDILE